MSGPKSLEARLDSMLDRLISRKDLHSVVAAVESRDGSFRWNGARGRVSPDGPPMAPDTPWFVASITKLFIASVVLRLVEEGELELGDRIVDRLPGRITERLHVLDGEDRTDRITVEHLLAHASGLPDFIEDHPVAGGEGPDADRRSLVDRLVEEGDRAFPLEAVADRVRERLRPHFPPQPLDGSRIRIRYSDTNYQLLIGIVEARRDRAFAEVLEALVLEPLGLEHTWLPGRPRGGGPEPVAAALYAGPERVDFPLFFQSIFDLNSTCGDLLRFLRAGAEGRLFRDPSTWGRMATARGRFSFPRDRASLRQPGWPIEYGLGVMRFRLPRAFTPLSRVPEVVGHTGSTGTWLFHAPEPDLYLVGAVSQITAGAVPFRWVPRMLRAAGEGRPTG